MENEKVGAENKKIKPNWEGVAWPNRLEYYKKQYIKHEDVRNAIAVIDEKLQEIDDSCINIPETDYLNSAETLGCGLMVIGDSGSGKSSLARYFLARHPRVNTPTQTFVPAVYMRIPPNVSPKSMAQALLTGLKHEDTKGTAKELLKRGVTLCHKCGVKIIMIDDFQDIPARRSKGMAAIGDWVRQLIDAVPALVIAMGTPSAEVVRDSNEQVRRRMQATARLMPFLQLIDDTTKAAETAISVKRWIGLLNDIEESLPMAVNSELSRPDRAILLMRASNASFAHLSTVLQRSMEIAVSEGKESLEDEHLRKGFAKTFGSAADNGNPWDPDYDGSPLTKPGQAFFKCEIEK
jgi:hypothetical protein